jgi:1,4-dihydroxy-2-naphthoate octaprenyltransferase
MSTLKGFLAEVRILPMSLMLLTTLLGGFFAAGPSINWKAIGLVLLNAFCFLYTAHLNDTYWDIRKGEYEEGRKLHNIRLNNEAYLPRWGFGYEIPNAPILPKTYYLTAMGFFSLLGLIIMVFLSTTLGWGYSAIALGGLILALTYSAGLDKVPAAGDTVWEFGVLLAMWCGYYSQKLTIDPFIVSTSVPLFISLMSIKALDSLPDTIVDNKTNKITLTVFLYRKGFSLKAIRHVAYVPFYVAFLILYFTLPSNLKLGALAVILAFIIQQLALRNDETGRKSIVVAGFTILAFTVLALAVIAGLIQLPSI